ncbi:MAG: DNA-directed RNA polymerase subunit omega [Clostridiales bacterium]|uniref:DNA-directed RNA polymerase subunit omega n=1 Tax=Candidatus Anaerobutyricum stercoripullorum TaxID=2838456 RepID=A0A9D2BDC1_9FIRM|nr:DNA-directed RNA polymerase subunit omega [Clostridiales bacterium]HIX72325.1 DNA-directed RNA polymerase subunit omega [Candidatus Anaerobutyricum stercoripullorum]
MLHPSYTELMEKINSEEYRGEEPAINSRYSIVIATSKRARELIGGARPLVEGVEGEKPLSIAVKELYDGKIKIMQEDEEVDFDDDLMDMDNLDAIDEEVEESDAIDFEGESSEAGESADETEE